jgi:uracil-DNA glycosylase family 4
VIGWHSSPLAGRRVFRLTYRTAEGVGLPGQVDVQLTGDHEVLTDCGWTPVEDLMPGARIATGQGLSPVAYDVLVGTLLGDATVMGTNAHVHIGHRPGQWGYAMFKASLMSELESHVDTVADRAVGSETAQTSVHVRTRASRAVRTVATDFHATGKKCVPDWVETTLNPRSLTIWFLDDGYMRLRPPRRPRAEIATGAFDDVSLGVLLRGLDRLGLPAGFTRNRIHFDVLTTRRLARMIAPYVPPSMRYKLPPDVEAELPFDESLFDDREPRVQFDEVIVEDVDIKGSDEAFFCIDVEETHNFVTSGGVVHNCRPPGNRDPLPAEIEACKPFLDRQLDLIDPSVVVTLGNFATRLLLETHEGIRRLRARAYPFRRGHLVPTYHPAAALRGGAEVVAEMRADLVRAKRLLGSPDA